MTRDSPARAAAPPAAARAGVGSFRREWLDSRRSTKPSPASSTRAMAMRTRVPSRIMVMSRWRMAVLNRPPRPPPPHEGGKDGGADGIDGGDADAGEEHGQGQGDLDVEQAVGRGHAHSRWPPPSYGRALGTGPGAVAHDGQQGVQGQAHHGGGGAGVQHHHNEAQQGQGGDGLDQVHYPQNDLARPGAQVGEPAPGGTPTAMAR